MAVGGGAFGRPPTGDPRGGGSQLAPGNGHGPASEEVEALDNPLEAEDMHSLDDVAAAAAAEAQVGPDHRYGVPGPPISRRSPFALGFSAAVGVAVAVVLIWTVYLARSLLVEIGLGLFIALGLDPIVTWLQRRGLPHWTAVVVVVVAGLGALAGVGDVVVPIISREVTHLINDLPHYESQLAHNSGFIGNLNARYHVVSTATKYLHGHESALASGLLGVGEAVLSGLLETLVVSVVAIYCLADLPRIKRTFYQLAPRSRRARVVLLGDEVFTRVGGYVLGNVAISVIAGIATWVWAMVFGIPYSLLLAVLVAVLDLIPLVGSTIGGVVVALVALTVSLPLAIATVAFYLLFRVLEDYLLTPRVMRATVNVPGIVTVIATLIGGTLLGIVGALVAIPVAAAIKLLVEEVTMPTLNRR